MITQSTLVRVFPGFNQAVLAGVGGWIAGKVRALSECRAPSAPYEFRIGVPGWEFELGGTGLWEHDVRPLPRPDGVGLVLITFARFTPETGRWSGAHVDEATQRIGVDRRLHAGTFCWFEMPDAGQLASADGHPCPRFLADVSLADDACVLERGRWAVDMAEPPSLEETILAGTG
jgi:hypothetical protein